MKPIKSVGRQPEVNAGEQYRDTDPYRGVAHAHHTLTGSTRVGPKIAACGVKAADRPTAAGRRAGPRMRTVPACVASDSRPTAAGQTAHASDVARRGIKAADRLGTAGRNAA